MFEKFDFTDEQLERYWLSAKKDLEIAQDNDISDVVFRFSYDALIKFAVYKCAKSGLRVKSKQGHHIALINFLAENLNNPEINTVGNLMRTKRNWDLYGGGILISQKDALFFKDFISKIIKL